MAIRTVLIDDNLENIKRLEEMIEDIYDVDIIATYNNPKDFLKLKTRGPSRYQR